MLQGQRIVTLSADNQYGAQQSPRWWSISIADYSGHRAYGGGSHYNHAWHGKINEEALIALFKPHLTKKPGPPPDLHKCDGCSKVCWGDELEIENWEAVPLRHLCPNCRKEAPCQRSGH